MVIILISDPIIVNESTWQGEMGADNAHYQPLNDDLIFIVGRSASILIFPLFFRNLPPIRRENQIMHQY